MTKTNNVVERLIAPEILREDAEFVLRNAHETIAPYAADRLRKAAFTVQSLSDRIAVMEGLISEQSIERLAEDIAVAVVEPMHVRETRHSAMVRLGERLRNPLPSDLASLKGAK